MKNLLKIFLLSSSLYACSNNADQDVNATMETDSSAHLTQQALTATATTITPIKASTFLIHLN